METLSIILGLVVAALCVIYIAWPFLRLTSRSVEETLAPVGELDILQEQRETILATIRELDFDYETGKLTDEDYNTQREVWVKRGVDVLKSIDVLDHQPVVPELEPVSEPLPVADSVDVDAEIEAAIAARRRSS